MSTLPNSEGNKKQNAENFVCRAAKTDAIIGIRYDPAWASAFSTLPRISGGENFVPYVQKKELQGAPTPSTGTGAILVYDHLVCRPPSRPHPTGP